MYIIIISLNAETKNSHSQICQARQVIKHAVQLCCLTVTFTVGMRVIYSRVCHVNGHSNGKFDSSNLFVRVYVGEGLGEGGRW